MATEVALRTSYVHNGYAISKSDINSLSIRSRLLLSYARACNMSYALTEMREPLSLSPSLSLYLSPSLSFCDVHRHHLTKAFNVQPEPVSQNEKRTDIHYLNHPRRSKNKHVNM